MPSMLGGDESIGVRVTTSANTDGIDKTSSSLNRLDSAAGISHGSFLKLSGAVAAGQAIFSVVSNALGALGNTAIKSSGEYEQSRIAFDTMLGSADKARDLMSQIAEFAKSTPFELPEVVAGTKQLLAFGFAQDQLLPTMRKLGDLAAGLGVPIGQLTNVYGQVRVAGRLMGQDLLQFTNAGVPMIEALATTLGKPQAQIKAMVERGEIDFPKVQAALDSLTGSGSKFGGMMEKQSHTFNGVVSNIKDGFGQMLRSAVGMTATGDIIKGSLFDRLKDVAEKAMPAVQAAALEVGPAMTKLMDRITNFGYATVEVAKKVGEYLLPKFEALWSTVDTKVMPLLLRLWHEVIEPLAPVIGTILVFAIGAAIDALNLFLSVITPIFDWMLNNKGTVIALATAFGVLAVAMNFNNIVSAFSGAMNGAIATINILRFSTIPGALSSLSSFAAGFGPVGIAAAVAAGMIIDAGNKAKAAWDGARNAVIGAANSDDEVIRKLQQLQKTGTAEQRQRASITLSRLAAGGAFASGTDFAPGGVSLVGEEGPELVDLPRGARVFPAGKTKQILSGSSSPITNTRTVTIGTVVIGTADAAREFFNQLDSDTLLTSRGMAPVRGS